MNSVVSLTERGKIKVQSAEGHKSHTECRGLQTLFDHLSQLQVAQILHSLPEGQDGAPNWLEGGVGVDQHGWKVPDLQRSGHGVTRLREGQR